MARPRVTGILILIIWLGFALRIHELAAVPLRGDEAFSALNWAGIPLHQSLTEIARLEPHPPLTYVLFRFWRHFVGGIDSPFALRLLPVFGNLIGVAAVYALAIRLSGERNGGLAAALIWAIHPYQIWHSQDFRNYAVWAGLSVTSLWLALRLIDRPLSRNWLLHALMALVCALTFYTEAFMSIAMALVAICWIRSDRHFLSRFVSLQGILVFIAVLAFLVLQAGLLEPGAYPGNLETLYIPDYLYRFLPVLTLGETAPGTSPWLWIALALALAVFTTIIARGSRRELLFIGAVILVPFLLLGVLSLRVNVFDPRYVLASIPGFALLISLGSARLAIWIAKTAGISQGYVMPLLLAPWVFLSALSLHSYYNDAAFRKSPAWDELGDFLNDSVSSSDLVIQLSADPAFGYYYRGSAEDRALPSGPLQSAKSIVAELQAARGSYDSIYVVSNAIPSWRNAGVVEDWMRDNMQPVMLSDASGLAIRQYKEWNVLDVPVVPLASFGGRVDLLDYRFFDDPLPSGELLLQVYWKPQAASGTSLKSFAHVYGEGNPESDVVLFAQDDQHPQSGRIDSRTWTPAEVFRDVYYLPTEALPDGSYELRIGWYDPASGQRLLTETGSDSFLLQGFDYPPKP